MPKYVVEREIPGSDKFTEEQLREIAQASCKVLWDLGPEIQWVQSFVTSNKFYCIYVAPNEEMIRGHAKEGRFPCDAINKISAIIDPVTAE